MTTTIDRIKARVREPVWATARAVLRPTAPLRVLPDYLIVGGQRCGTTSLQQVLSQHPCIGSARLMKGVHYFDTAYHHDLDWYRTHFPTRAHASLVERRHGSPLVVGEASPYYMFHPLSVERIARDLPDVKLIALLRDPVERAISHHKHETRRGNESLDLSDALEAEEQRLAGEIERVVREDPHYNSHALQTFSYVGRGMYAAQLRRMMETFDPSRVLVLRSEAFFEDPETAYLQALEFLGVPAWTPDSFPRANATRDSSVAPEVKQRLIDRFAGPNRELFDLIGETYPWQ